MLLARVCARARSPLTSLTWLQRRSRALLNDGGAEFGVVAGDVASFEEAGERKDDEQRRTSEAKSGIKRERNFWRVSIGGAATAAQIWPSDLAIQIVANGGEIEQITLNCGGAERVVDGRQAVEAANRHFAPSDFSLRPRCLIDDAMAATAATTSGVASAAAHRAVATVFMRRRLAWRLKATEKVRSCFAVVGTAADYYCRLFKARRRRENEMRARFAVKMPRRVRRRLANCSRRHPRRRSSTRGVSARAHARARATARPSTQLGNAAKRRK